MEKGKPMGDQKRVAKRIYIKESLGLLKKSYDVLGITVVSGIVCGTVPCDVPNVVNLPKRFEKAIKFLKEFSPEDEIRKDYSLEFIEEIYPLVIDGIEKRIIKYGRPGSKKGKIGF